jgi:hypothetical protein
LDHLFLNAIDSNGLADASTRRRRASRPAQPDLLQRRRPNAAIAELLEKLNSRPFKKLEGCRRSAFEALDRPALCPLPQARWELARWKKAKVSIDYHVDHEARLYSVPRAFVGEYVDPPVPTVRAPKRHLPRRQAL